MHGAYNIKLLTVLRIERDIITDIHKTTCKVPRYLHQMLMQLEYPRQIFVKIHQIFKKIRPEGDELFHADGQAGRLETNRRFS